MQNFFRSPVGYTLLATFFTWGVTALGAGVVFFFKSINKNVLNFMLSFGAGVMIAASFWSLLNPAIILCEELGYNSIFIPSFGFLLGALLIVVSDKYLTKKLKNIKQLQGKNTEGLKRSILLVSAVTLHNFPEGLAVGVAFGVAAVNNLGFGSAILLAIGIGLQNFPEGLGVALPLRREGFSRKKSFFYGQLSGFVEPIAGLIGVCAALTVQSILPFMLAFSAGAMISVVTSELIPESASQNKNLAVMGVTIGFICMMVLDVALS